MIYELYMHLNVKGKIQIYVSNKSAISLSQLTVLGKIARFCQ